MFIYSSLAEKNELISADVHGAIQKKLRNHVKYNPSLNNLLHYNIIFAMDIRLFRSFSENVSLLRCGVKILFSGEDALRCNKDYHGRKKIIRHNCVLHTAAEEPACSRFDSSRRKFHFFHSCECSNDNDSIHHLN